MQMKFEPCLKYSKDRIVNFCSAKTSCNMFKHWSVDILGCWIISYDVLKLQMPQQFNLHAAL